MSRILFSLTQKNQIPVFQPIWQEFLARSFEIGCHQPSGSSSHLKGNGNGHLTFGTQVRNVEHPASYQADLVFTAGPAEPSQREWGPIVNLGNGLLGRGQHLEYGVNASALVESLILVPGKLHRELLGGVLGNSTPVSVVGYPKLDPLFRPGAASRDQLCRQAGLDPARKIVIYAPTDEMTLSAVPILWTRIRELASPQIYLLVKLHSEVILEFVEAHQRMAVSNPNIRFVADLDITPYLQLADLMVSDVSSAALEFALLDKPVVLFDNPNLKDYLHYHPESLEFRWRDIGQRVSDLPTLKAAILQGLAHPDQFASRRSELREVLGIPLDGRAAQRVVDEAIRMMNWMKGKQKPLVTLPETTAVTQLESGNGNGSRKAQAMRRIRELASAISSAIPNESDAERVRRLEAESHLKLARHYLCRGNPVVAVDAAIKALECYPQCTAALGIVEIIKVQSSKSWNRLNV